MRREFVIALRATLVTLILTGLVYPFAMTGVANDFLQLGGSYRVKGHAGNRAIDFTARGAAETFRPH